MAFVRVDGSRPRPRRWPRRRINAHFILRWRVPLHRVFPPQPRAGIAAQRAIRRPDDGVDLCARVFKDEAVGRGGEGARGGGVGAVAGGDEDGGRHYGVGLRRARGGGGVGDDVDGAVCVEQAAVAADCAAESAVGCRGRDDAGGDVGDQCAAECAPGGVDGEGVAGLFGRGAGVSVSVIAVFVVGAGSRLAAEPGGRRCCTAVRGFLLLGRRAGFVFARVVAVGVGYAAEFLVEHLFVLRIESGDKEGDGLARSTVGACDA